VPSVKTALTATGSCPHPTRLRGVCGMISARLMDKTTNDYLYRIRIYQAAGINEYDSDEIKIQKIRKMWALLEDQLVCDSTQFDVSKGNILKYAASTKHDAFIRDAITWGVNLNRVDPTDNRTVLDYISFHIERHKGNALEGMFAHYNKLLKAGGTKHKNEL